MEHQWYYLIDLDGGRTILRCPGAHEVASEHLKQIRQTLEASGRIGKTVKHPHYGACLIGVYRPYTAVEEAYMPKSYGYLPNLLGSIDTDPNDWQPTKESYG